MSNTTSTLFSHASTEVLSRRFLVRPGQAVLLTAFGIPDSTKLAIKKILTERGTMPDGDACSGPKPTIPTTMLSDAVSVCCDWALTHNRNTMFVTVPGVYQLELDNPEALGSIFVELMEIPAQDVRNAPAGMVFGSEDCGCVQAGAAQITCADLQALFVPGEALQFYGVNSVGQCVTSPVPTFTETPIVILDSQTIDLTSSGPMGHTLTAVVKVSGDPGNIIEIRAGGLYVEAKPQTPFVANDSNTIDFTTSGPDGHVLTGVVRVSADSGNTLITRPDGLYVPPPAAIVETPLTVLDTTTVDLTSTGPNGHQISAVVKVSTAANNRLGINPDGLYVPPVSCADVSAVFVPGVVAVAYGRDAGGNCVYGPISSGPGPTVETPLTANDSSTVDFTTSGTQNHTITAVVRVDPAPGNQIIVTPGGLRVDPPDCADVTALFAPGAPVAFLGVDEAGNCVRGAPASVVVDCDTIRGAFQTDIPASGSVKLLAVDDDGCGVVDLCEIGDRALTAFGSVPAPRTISGQELRGVCDTTMPPQADPIIFSTATFGFYGANNFNDGPQANSIWPVVTAPFEIVAGQVLVISLGSAFTKFETGAPAFALLSIGFGAATGEMLDDPYSLPMGGGNKGWLSAWVWRSNFTGTMQLTFSVTGATEDALKSYQAQYLVTRVSTTSGQPATYTEMVQGGTHYSLQSAAPNNVLQAATFGAQHDQYQLYVFGSYKTNANGLVVVGDSFRNHMYGSNLGASVDPTGYPVVRVTETAGNTEHVFMLRNTEPYVVGTRYRASIVFKMDAGAMAPVNQILLMAQTTPGSLTFANVTNGSAGWSDHVESSTSRLLAGGWAEITIEFVATSANVDTSVNFAIGGDLAYAGNAAKFMDFGRFQVTRMSDNKVISGPFTAAAHERDTGVTKAAIATGNPSGRFNLALMHAAAVGDGLLYGVNSNDAGDVTSDPAYEYDSRAVYKGFRFHSILEGTPVEGQPITFHTSSARIGEAEVCGEYMTSVSLSGALVDAWLPPDTAYRIAWTLNGQDVAWQMLDNIGGEEFKRIYATPPMVERQIAYSDLNAEFVVQARIDCVKGNEDYDNGSVLVNPAQLYATAIPMGGVSGMPNWTLSLDGNHEAWSVVEVGTSAKALLSGLVPGQAAPALRCTDFFGASQILTGTTGPGGVVEYTLPTGALGYYELTPIVRNAAAVIPAAGTRPAGKRTFAVMKPKKVDATMGFTDHTVLLSGLVGDYGTETMGTDLYSWLGVQVAGTQDYSWYECGHTLAATNERSDAQCNDELANDLIPGRYQAQGLIPLFYMQMVRPSRRAQVFAGDTATLAELTAHCLKVATHIASAYSFCPKHIYQISWEPDLAFRDPLGWGGSEASFLAFCAAVSSGIRAGDPNAVIIGPAFSNINDVPYYGESELIHVRGTKSELQYLLDAGLKNSIDAVSQHNYFIWNDDRRMRPDTNGTEQALKDIITDSSAKFGHTVDLYCTEAGYPNTAGGVTYTAAQRAYATVAMALLTKSAGAKMVGFFMMTDYTAEDGFGIMYNTDPDYGDGYRDYHSRRTEPKPEFPMIRQVSDVISNAIPRSKAVTAGDVAGVMYRGYENKTTNVITLAVWDTTDANRTINITVGVPTVVLQDVFGNQTTVDTVAGVLVGIKLHRYPVYLVGVSSGIMADGGLPPTPPAGLATFERPFSIDSPWNLQPVNPVLNTAVGIHENTYTPDLHAGNFSVRFWKATAADGPHTVYPIAGRGGIGDADLPGLRPSITFARFPSGGFPADSTDGHFDFLDTVTGLVHSLFECKLVGGQWQVGTYAVTRIDGRGFGDGAHWYQGVRAVGCPPIGGLVRTWEVNGGFEFEHALALSLPHEDLMGSAPGYVYPATFADDGYEVNTGTIPEGALLMLPATFNVDALRTEDCRRIARALKKYGARVVDRNFLTPFVIYVEQGTVGFGHGGGWVQPVADDLLDIRLALHPMASSSGWRNTNGQIITDNPGRLNMLSLRNPWTVYAGSTTLNWNVEKQRLEFGAVAAEYTLVGAYGIQDRIKPFWAQPVPGGSYRVVLSGTNATFQIQVVDAADTAVYSTPYLAPGEAHDFVWPATAATAKLWILPQQGSTGGWISVVMNKLGG